MDGILNFIDWLSNLSVSLGFADALPSGSVYLIVAFCLIGTHLVNGLAKRRSLFHLAVSLSAMFIGAVAGNLLLAGFRVPLNNEMVVSALFALMGMTITGLGLLFAYRRADF